MIEQTLTSKKNQIEIIETPNFKIYRLPLPTPFAVGRINCYIIESEELTLIDTGPFTEKTKQDFEDKLQQLNFKISDFKNIFITHGHLDHHGLLHYIQTQSKAKTYVHYLDADKVTNHYKKYSLSSEKIAKLLLEAGLDKDVTTQTYKGYQFVSSFCENAKVDMQLKEETIKIDSLNFKIIHTPGHCEGSICINIDGYLFVGDNLLKKISPNPFFKEQGEYLGLTNFTNSLKKIRNLKNIKEVYPGHGEHFTNYKERISEILHHHRIRKKKILELLIKPLSIIDIINSGKIFPGDLGYELFLAVIEIKSHLEVLEEEKNIEGIMQGEKILYKISYPDPNPLDLCARNII